MKRLLIIFLLFATVCFGDTFTSHLKPTADSALDLGTTSLLWRFIYTDAISDGTATWQSSELAGFSKFGMTSGSFTVSLNPSTSMTESVNYFLPVADATAGGQALLSNGAGVLRWGTPVTSSAHALMSSTHSDTTTTPPARGDIIIGNATPKWVPLAIGDADKFLQSNGTDVSWAFIDISDSTNLAVDIDHLKLTDDTLSFSDNEKTVSHSRQGSFLEQIDFTVTEAGGTVTGSLEKEGTGDLTQFWSDDFDVLDCTGPVCTVNLTAFVGTDATPAAAFVYILQSAKTTLVANTSFPANSVEHIRVCSLVLQSAVTTGTEGALMVRNWNDPAFGITNPRGGDIVSSERVRKEHALYDSGIVLTITGSGTGTVTLDTTAGAVYQFNLQAFPSIDMAGADNIHIVNQVTNAGAAYETSVNLVADVTHYDDGIGGSTISNNKYFNIVVWGVQNRTGVTSHLMCNIPTGQYGKQGDAIVDAEKFSVHTIPSTFRGTGFLIAELTFQFTSGRAWTLIQNKDLLGQTPTLVPGGGTTSIISTFVDSAFEVFDNGDDTKRMNFELSSVTTGNTRTLTVPDTSSTILTSDGTTPLDGAWSLGGQNLTSAGNITGTDVDISAGTGDYSSTGTITSGDITIFDATPILIFQDSNSAGASSVGFIEWKDSGGGRAGFLGNHSSSNDDLLWKNEQGGDIGIETTGAGEFQILANTVLNGNSITSAGNLTGTDVDISAGTGDYSSTGAVNPTTVTTTGSITAGTNLIIGSAIINEAELERIDGTSEGTNIASKAVVSDASKDVDWDNGSITQIGDPADGTTGLEILGHTALGSGAPGIDQGKLINAHEKRTTTPSLTGFQFLEDWDGTAGATTGITGINTVQRNGQNNANNTSSNVAFFRGFNSQITATKTQANDITAFIHQRAFSLINGTTYTGTIGNIHGFWYQNSISNSPAITNIWGLEIDAISDATNNYGIVIGDISGGTINQALKTGLGDVEFGDTADGITVAVNGSIIFDDVSATPDAVGEILYDNTITNLADGGFSWFDDDAVRVMVDMPIAEFGTPTNGHVVTYNATSDGFELTAAAGGGDVTAAAVMTDHTIIRGDGGAKGVQDSGITIDDSDNVTGVTSINFGDENLATYDEGTWTPVLGGATSESGQSYSLQAGRYTKIGNMVTCTFAMTISDIGTIVGVLHVKGLPFTSGSNAYSAATLSLRDKFTLTTGFHLSGFLNQSNNFIQLRQTDFQGSLDVTVPNTAIESNSALAGSIVYFVD